MRLCLVHPEIPQNVGTLIRLGACLNVPIDVIEPCGFLFTDKKLKRAGMDYMDLAVLHRYDSWEVYQKTRMPGRLIALAPRASTYHHEFSFAPNDILVLGQESLGLNEMTLKACEALVAIPQVSKTRSLNVAIAGAIVLGEALRQTQGFTF
ncbi:tRNA (cytidine(34)-2'-O)-methyltransferase [Candidatus Bealeia paramacronuclearis]|uniref:tRNA (cytidine(34)-2'-O)-methyltransferase n=1 Tax=Candidatus Bealeia paramacronuclearis TaxID=1921001 RepID=A0ABZ2C2E7_9PROT|nr:tRNA (cytidine(34)-2'-O)-methyltransferase [Candidatus Bealeia paramacronuclearis]